MVRLKKFKFEIHCEYHGIVRWNKKCCPHKKIQYFENMAYGMSKVFKLILEVIRMCEKS